MPPPLAVIWRTWPQILSPFAIWAVLSWLQGSFRFRLIPPSSPVACQSQTESHQLSLVFMRFLVYTWYCFVISLVITALFSLYCSVPTVWSKLYYAFAFAYVWYCFYTYFVGIILPCYKLLWVRFY